MNIFLLHLAGLHSPCCRHLLVLVHVGRFTIVQQQNHSIARQSVPDWYAGYFNVLLLQRMLHSCMDISEHLQTSFAMTNPYIYNCRSQGVCIFIFTGPHKLPCKKFVPVNIHWKNVWLPICLNISQHSVSQVLKLLLIW